MSSDSKSNEDWARLLAEGWEKRASHPSRDLYVASNPGWRDPEVWARYARQDLDLFLIDLDRDELQQTDVLEIGCGSGRLVPFLRPMVRSYTGFDIAPSMVEGARERCADLEDVRFLLGDGLGVPDEARDRQYGLILCVAVFIHCPKQVVRSNVESAWPLLAPGGQFRFQVLADPEDRTGLAEVDTTEGLVEEVQNFVAEVTEEEMALASDTHYLGHPFGYDEVLDTMRSATGGRVALHRGDLGSIYGLIENPR